MKRFFSWRFLKAVIAAWIDDRCLSMGAAIAYYAAFSLAPMLILVIAIAALVFGREAAQGAIVGQLGVLLGPEGAAALEAMIANASRSGSGWLANLIGVGALLLAATGTVGEIQASLNVIWKAAPSKESTVRAFLRRKLLSYAFVVVMGFLLMVSLVIPEVDDEVLVGFERGDLRFPYVLGALWNSGAKPPLTNDDGKNDKRILKSRKKHYLLFDDGNGGVVELAHENGAVVRLADDGIAVKDKQGNQIKVTSQTGAMTIESNGQLSIKAATITIEASGALTVKAGATLSMRGALVNIN